MKASRIFNVSLIVFPILTLIFYFNSFTTLTITFITINYHIFIRALCGTIFSIVKINGNERIFNVSEKELKIYEKLNVKSWKEKLPTYKPELFKERDLNKLYSNMLHSELVHIAIVFFSYVPLIISIFYSYLHDSILIFLFTSIFASLLDTSFIILQRYNRPRVKHLMTLQTLRTINK